MAHKTFQKKINTIKKIGKIKTRNKVSILVPKCPKNNTAEGTATKEETSKTHHNIIVRSCEYLSFANVNSYSTEAMATYYPQYQLQPNYTFPIRITELNPIVNTIQASSSLYTAPLPVPILLTTPQVVTQICPYTGVLVAEPVLTSIIPSPVITEIVPVSNSYKPIIGYSPEVILTSNPTDINEQLYPDEASAINQNVSEDNNTGYEVVQMDPLEFYLTLPKELFPTARMFSLDPNPLIDEFCKLGNVNENMSWILDLEFGIPRAPVTRVIPVYDVQFNSVHCKNTPGAIHPGFESCSSDFKKVFLFYYDCIISAWYKGYIIMNDDKSVKNFQAWLLVPMQIFGMCWP